MRWFTLNKLRNFVLISLFAALASIGAFIRIPVPVVPFTLQFLFTMLAGLLLGGRLGAVSVLVYILIGLLGAPVFAGGGGPAYVLQPTFGYLLGFSAGALATGVIANRDTHPTMRRLLAANFTGLGIVYAFSMLYYWLISTFYTGRGIGLWPLFLYCFILAVPGDAVLCVVAAVIAKRLIPARSAIVSR